MKSGRQLGASYLCLTSVVTVAAFALASDESARANQNRTELTFDEKLDALDRRIETVHDLRADFEQRKYTTLLKKPLVSRGELRTKGSQTRWDTRKPRRSTLVISPTNISVYYPKQALLEVYELDEQLRWLAVSPLPRMASLREHFNLTLVSVETFDKRTRPKDALGVRLTPRGEAMRNHLSHVDVLIDNRTALVAVSIITDADGDRTELIFSKMRTNTGLDDDEVTLHIPEGTKTVHPLGQQESHQAKKSGGER